MAAVIDMGEVEEIHTKEDNVKGRIILNGEISSNNIDLEENNVSDASDDVMEVDEDQDSDQNGMDVHSIEIDDEDSDDSSVIENDVRINHKALDDGAEIHMIDNSDDEVSEIVDDDAADDKDGDVHIISENENEEDNVEAEAKEADKEASADPLSAGSSKKSEGTALHNDSGDGDVEIIEHDTTPKENGSSHSPATVGQDAKTKEDDEVINLDTPIKKFKKQACSPTEAADSPRRRSARNLTRQKSYKEKEKDESPSEEEEEEDEEEEESDIEEIFPQDPLAVGDPFRDRHIKRKAPKPSVASTIVVKDTKRLVEIASKSNPTNSGKKEPTLVIIDTNSILSGRGPIPINQKLTISQQYPVLPMAVPAQGLYPPNMRATITPIPMHNPSPPHPKPAPTLPPKSVSSLLASNLSSVGTLPPLQTLQTLQLPPASSGSCIPSPIQLSPTIQQPAPPQILPSLTDDMFVVEAPSFIVPYVYEKPPVKDLREFVDNVAKHIAQRLKAEEEKMKLEEEQREAERAREEAERKEIEARKEEETRERDEKIAMEELRKEIAEKEKEKLEDEAEEAETDIDKDDPSKNKEREDEVTLEKEAESEKDVRKEMDDEEGKEDEPEKEKQTEVAEEMECDKAKESEREKDDTEEIKAAEEKMEEDAKEDKKDEIHEIKDDDVEEITEGTAKEISTEKLSEALTKPKAEQEAPPKPKVEEKIEKPKEQPVVLEEPIRRPYTYFDSPLGKFFMDIGHSLVQEFVQTDLLKQQKRKRERESGKNPETNKTISSLIKNLEYTKENNGPYHMPVKKCEFCSFKTESALAMAFHLETPHMKNFVYRCNFCSYEVRSPHDILFHMEAEHTVRGRLERAPAFHQCPNCPFEDNQKGKLSRHMVACTRKFKPERNLEPPIDWEPPAKIPRVPRMKSSNLSSTAAMYQAMAKNSQYHIMQKMQNAQSALNRGRGRPSLGNVKSPPVMRTPTGMIYKQAMSGGSVLLPTNYQLSGNQLYQVVGGQEMGGRIGTGTPMTLLPNISSATSTLTIQQHSAPNKTKPVHQPSISITPLPRNSAASAVVPVAAKPGESNAKNSFVICEICDGYIKDLEQLRNHMQWIHKVKIHPKMIYNRPPLNCQKCQFRFFTDQGLERHLLGSHGLVTSSMQEAANKSKDSGRCPVCGRVYQWKLLNHVARDHNMTLKPAHLSYKCTVCTATFGMYKQFENHVYSAHSVVAKRVMDKKGPTSSPNAGKSDSLLKPLKINDEITIIPQMPKASGAGTSKEGSPITSLTKNSVSVTTSPSTSKSGDPNSTMSRAERLARRKTSSGADN